MFVNDGKKAQNKKKLCSKIATNERAFCVTIKYVELNCDGFLTWNFVNFSTFQAQQVTIK